MFDAMTYPSHEAYFETVPPGARLLLESIQAEVKGRVPDATACISYNMPAFKLRRTFFYFAAFEKHIGVYPPLHDDPALMAHTARYRGPKGNLTFALDEPLPLKLIGQVAAALALQYADE